MDDAEIFARSLVARLGGQAFTYSLVRARQFASIDDRAGETGWEEVANKIKYLQEISPSGRMRGQNVVA